MTNMEYLVKKDVPASDLAATLFTAPSEAILEWLSTEYVTDIITDFERKKLNNWLTIIRQAAGNRTSIVGIGIVGLDKKSHIVNPFKDNDNNDAYIMITYKECSYRYDRYFLIDKNTEFLHLRYNKIYQLVDLGIEREDFVDE